MNETNTGYSNKEPDMSGYKLYIHVSLLKITINVNNKRELECGNEGDNFFNFNFVVPMGIFSHGKFGVPSMRNASCDSRATQP